MSSSTRSKRRPSVALAVCIAAGTAVGIGLARPGPSQPGPSQPGSQVAVSPEVGDHNDHGGHQQSAAPGYRTPNPQAAPPVTGNPVITISEFTFDGSLRVSAGQTVTVNNVDGVAHSLTADNGSFDTGVFDAGASSSFVAPTTPGSYEFSCLVHPPMRGTLIVEA